MLAITFLFHNYFIILTCQSQSILDYSLLKKIIKNWLGLTHHHFKIIVRYQIAYDAIVLVFVGFFCKPSQYALFQFEWKHQLKW
jgi:hypothetical protein